MFSAAGAVNGLAGKKGSHHGKQSEKSDGGGVDLTFPGHRGGRQYDGALAHAVRAGKSVRTPELPGVALSSRRADRPGARQIWRVEKVAGKGATTREAIRSRGLRCSLFSGRSTAALCLLVHHLLGREVVALQVG